MSRFLSTNQILPWQYLLVQPAVTCPPVAASFLPSAGIVFHTYPLPIENQKGGQRKVGGKVGKSFPSRLSYTTPIGSQVYILPWWWWRQKMPSVFWHLRFCLNSIERKLIEHHVI